MKARTKRTGSTGPIAKRQLAVHGGMTTWADCAVALRLIGSGRLLDGTELAEYERAFAREIGVSHALSFSTGRVGLYGLLLALGVGAGDDVLLQLPTHVVVPNAIRYTGARLVYVDCRVEDYNIDLAQAEQRLTPRTKVLVLQHTFGIPSDIDAACAFAERHRIVLIEDCVHSLGARFDGRAVGSFGRAAFFSTEETKTISSTMGGMVVTNDDDLVAALRLFQRRCRQPPASLTRRYLAKLVLYHALTEPHVHRFARAMYGMTGRRHALPRATIAGERRGAAKPSNYEQQLSNAQAVVVLRQLQRLDENVAHRRAVAERYETRLREAGFRTPTPTAKAEPVYVRYPVWVQDRERSLRATRRHAVLGTWFESVLEESEGLSAFGYESGSCSRAEAAAKHLVNLPTHQRVTPGDVDAIVSALAHAQPPASDDNSVDPQRQHRDSDSIA